MGEEGAFSMSIVVESIVYCDGPICAARREAGEARASMRCDLDVTRGGAIDLGSIPHGWRFLDGKAFCPDEKEYFR